MRADWPIVLAAWFTMLLATTLLAAGPIYSSAVSVAGLRQLLAESSIEAGNVRVSAGAPLAQVGAVDQAISDELHAVAGTLPAELARFGTADSFALPGQGSDVRDLAASGFADGVERHATLVAGAWPQAAPGSGSGGPAQPDVPVEVAISDAVAEQLSLAVGERLDLVSRRDAQRVLPVTIAAVYRIDDPGDPFWWADAPTLDGLTESGQYRTFGPFLMDRADLLDRAATARVSLSWRLLPDYAGITIDDVAHLRTRLSALPNRLNTVAGRFTPSVVTALPQTLETAARALLVSRTGMLLVMAQLALLGGYAILLTAGLLIDHRRLETALLRARGAGPARVAWLAAIEGLLLAVPAVLLGPLCAIVALSAFDRIGPMSAVGLTVPLQVTTDAYVAAGIAGSACVALLALPALFSARAFSAEQRSLSREETKPLLQRLGIDLALLAVAAIAVWQLRLYGAPLTRNLQGSLGPDPLLIAAPALGLLLGAVVATRLLPRLAEGAQELLAHGRGLVGALWSFQLARRPLRYTRSALMLMLAMSIAVFAVSYATTWADSQRSQADHQVGADVRVVPSRSPRAMPGWSLAAAYSALPGVEQATPVERYPIQLNPSVRGTLLALDAHATPGMVRFRADQATTPFADLLAPLAAARPTVALPTIPEGSTGVIGALTIDVGGLERSVMDPATDEVVRVAQDPAAFAASATIGVGLAVRDAHGLVHRFTAPPPTPDDSGSTFEILFAAGATSTAQAAGLRLDGQLELVSLDLSLSLPADLIVTDGSVSIARIAAMADSGEPVPIDTGQAQSWRLRWVDARGVPSTLSPSGEVGLGIQIGPQKGGDAPREVSTDGTNPFTVSMQPAAIADLAPLDMPVLLNRQAVQATGLETGDTLQVELAGAARRLRISGVVESFPTTDASSPAVVVDLPTLALLRLQTVHGADAAGVASAVPETRRPDEWWLDLDSPARADANADVADEVTRALGAPPFASSSVVTAAGRLRSLVSDPVAVGIIGALGLGALAAGLFALIGLAVAASVSARQRQSEFALVRALGLSRRQLAGWLWLENGSLAVVSVLVGTALGALISWVVLPSVTVTADGLPPTPPVIVTLPLTTIAVLALLAAVALAAVVLVMAAALRRMGVGNVLRLGEE